MKSVTYPILFGVISIAVSACSSGAAEPTATAVPVADIVAPVAPTAARTSQEVGFYLDSIENNAVQVTAAFARIEEHLSRVWPVRSSLFDAFSDAELSQEIISSIGAIVQLSPPAEFEQEHRILQETAKTVVAYTQEFEQALQDRDLAGVMVAKANFAVSYKRMVLTVSPRLCNALGIDNDRETLCDVRAGTPGTYDAEVEQLIKEYRLEFLPRVTSFPLALSEEERFGVLSALNVYIEIANQNAVSKLVALTPPEERADDHRILLTYLEDTSETASAITVAAANRDNSKIEQLFAQSGTIVESAAASISCEYREVLLHGFFPGCVP
ncbi:MAG: hypothetical protein O6922_03015 [Chloroflexi bacterium]|nr:hypothetical protein [Chloroflexota bacterium]